MRRRGRREEEMDEWMNGSVWWIDAHVEVMEVSE